MPDLNREEKDDLRKLLETVGSLVTRVERLEMEMEETVHASGSAKPAVPKRATAKPKKGGK